MKILLDENIDVNFKEDLLEYNIDTVKDKGWTGIENGKLLELVIKNGYEFFITLDSNLRYQQNLSQIKFYIIILKAKNSRLAHLKLFTPKLKNTLDKLIEKEVFEVFDLSL